MGPFLPQRFLIGSPVGGGDPNVFPLLSGQSFLVSKRPTWSTTIATASSGRERRQQRWSSPKWQFKVAYEVIADLPSLSELTLLLAFFNAQAGRGGSFNLILPGDNTAVAEPFGTGDGTTTTFTLTRTLRSGAILAPEPVGAAIGTPTVFVGAAPIAAFTLAGNTVTFASPPAAGAALTWTGRYAYRVRFDQDDLDVAQMTAQLWSQSGLAMISVRE